MVIIKGEPEPYSTKLIVGLLRIAKFSSKHYSAW